MPPSEPSPARSNRGALPLTPNPPNQTPQPPNSKNPANKLLRGTTRPPELTELHDTHKGTAHHPWRPGNATPEPPPRTPRLRGTERAPPTPPPAGVTNTTGSDHADSSTPPPLPRRGKESRERRRPLCEEGWGEPRYPMNHHQPPKKQGAPPNHKNPTPKTQTRSPDFHRPPPRPAFSGGWGGIVSPRAPGRRGFRPREGRERMRGGIPTSGNRSYQPLASRTKALSPALLPSARALTVRTVLPSAGGPRAPAC